MVAERPGGRDGGGDDLRAELPEAAAVEQAGDGALDAVPAVAVGAVGEQARRRDAPEAADAVHGDRADRVVDLELALDEDDGADHDEAGDDADDEGADRGRRRRTAR